MTSDPFLPGSSKPSFLETATCAEALHRLEAGLGAREPFLVLTGEPGTGKTMLANAAIQRWESRVVGAFLAGRASSGTELMEEIVFRFGGDPPLGASQPRLVACFERVLGEIAGRGRVAMIVVDEAQNLSPELLEELRLLTNAAQQSGHPLEVLLVGLPALESLLDRPELAALGQRVSVRARLKPLSVAETRQYLRHRVDAVGGDGAGLFPRKTSAEIAELTGGVPRRINVLAHEALRLARAARSPSVQPNHVRAASQIFKPPAAGVVRADAVPAPPQAPPATTRPAPTDTMRADVRPAAATKRVEPSRAPTVTRSPADASAQEHDSALPTVPLTHDASEWVARFVGTGGPVRIGALAATPKEWAAELDETVVAETELSSEVVGTTEPPEMPSSRPRSPRAMRPRPRRGGGRHDIVTYALGTLVVLAGIGMVVLMGTRWSRRAGPLTAVSASAPAAPFVASGVSKRPVVVAKGPAAVAGSPASDSTRTVERPNADRRRRFTLDVGEYVDLQHAFDERNRIQELTGMEAWVVPAPEGTYETHHIVIGVYRSEERANAAANMLLETQTLRQATVVPLPKRTARQ